MKYLALLFVLGLFGCATPGAQSERGVATAGDSSHKTVFGHGKHKHGEKCGHESKTAGFDTLYNHDGEWHKHHGDHVDIINK